MLEDFYSDYFDERLDFYRDLKLRKMMFLYEKINNFSNNKAIFELEDRNKNLISLKEEVKKKKVTIYNN